MIPFPEKKYQVIYADPPWKYGAWGIGSNRCALAGSTANHAPIPMPYPTMTVKEICELPVPQITADNCDLYLWVTQKYLPDSFFVMGAWGFRYCQTLAWCKTPRGTGQGGLYCPTTEFLIVGRKGKMPTGKVRKDSTWWNIKRPHNSHSTKPGFFRDLITEMSNGPRIELFARRTTPGWDVWGNEIDNDMPIFQEAL
jgi:N6-adenosine-specific RNA methylase IME4